MEWKTVRFIIKVGKLQVIQYPLTSPSSPPSNHRQSTTMAAVTYPCNLLPLPYLSTRTTTKTSATVSFSVTAVSRQVSATSTAGVVAAPSQPLLQFSFDSLQYEQGKVGAVPDGRVSDSPPVGAMEYLTNILTSKVYEVAMESPLQHAGKLSEKLGVDVWLKREDTQPVSACLVEFGIN